MSALMARLENRAPRPIFSKKPAGLKSTVSSMWVRRGASSWKVTTPACLSPLTLRQTIRSSGRCSTISALKSRVKFHIFSVNVT